MGRKRQQPQVFEYPPEVVDADPPLPPELAAKGPLTLREKKKCEKRRDALMALHGTAARLSNEEQSLNHARISADTYRTELNRLLELRSKARTGKRELDRIIKATANNLADALCQQGLLGQAYIVLTHHDPKSGKLEYITELGRAHARNDNESCDCPPSEKSVSRVFNAARAEFVDLVRCACGDTNATGNPPASVVALQKARARAPEGATDAAIIKQAERL